MPLSEAELNEHREIEKLVKEFDKDSTWVKDEPQSGMEIFLKTVKNPATQADVAAAAGTGEVPHSAEALIAGYIDNTLRLEWDNKNFGTSVTLEEVDPTTDIVYRISNNLPWPMSQRDTVNRQHESREADGSIVLTWKGVTHASKPAVSTYVRGSILFGALWVRPVTEKSCKIVLAVAYDPSGSLPFALVSKAIKSAPLVIRALQTFLDTPANLAKAVAIVERKRAKRAAAGIYP